MNKKSVHIIGGIAGIVILAIIVSFLGIPSYYGYGSFATSSPEFAFRNEGVSSLVSQQKVLAEFDTSGEPLMENGIEDPTAGPVGGDIEQKIIRNGSLELLVDSITETLTDISEIAKRHGGFTQNSNAGEWSNGTRYGSSTIRVPFDSYDAAMAELKDGAIKVTSESSNAQDVTEQYTDLQAQLSVAREEEQAFVRLLDRSASVPDLLQVQRELSRVRTRIESLEGRIQYLDNQTALATITISLAEESSLTVPTKPFRPLASITDALQSLVVIGQGVVIVLIWAVILGIGIGVPVYALSRILRALYRRIKR